MADDITVKASLQDDLSKPLENVRKKVRDVGDEATRAGAKAKVGGGGFATFGANLRTASGSFKGFMSQAKSSSTGLDAFKTAAGKLGKSAALAATGAVTGLGAALVGAAGLGVKTAADMETAKVGFDTMLGSAEKSSKFLADLQNFAAATPFEFPELQTAASSLISIGIESDKVIPIMKSLGDVTSGMGTGSEGVKRATVALQQMNAAGRITAEDLNQLRDAGIPVFDLLSKATGKSKEEIAGMAQAGELGKTELDAMMKTLESGKGLERFNGLMEKQSKTLAGRFSTLKDNVTQGLAKAVDPLKPVLGAALDTIAAKVGSIDFTAIGTQLAAAIGSVDWAGLASTVGDIVAKLGALASWASSNGDILAPIAVGIGALAAAWAVWNGVTAIGTAVQTAFNAVLAANPVMLVVMAVAALTAGLIYFFTQTETGKQAWASFTAFMSDFWNDTVTDVTAGFNAVVGWFNGLGAAISGGLASFATTVSNGVGAAVRWFAGLPGRIAGALTSFGATVRGKASSAATALWSAVKGGIDRAVSFVRGLPGRASAALGGLASALSGVAGRAVDALVRAFTGLGGKIAGALSSAYDTAMQWAGKIGDAVSGALSSATGGLVGGDTATSRARGAGSWAAAVPNMTTGQRVTNIGVGGGGRGPGSGDHQAGRAVDIAGPHLGRLIGAVKAQGGYGALHGTGSNRHAHLVPAAGDTATTRARLYTRPTPTPTGGGVTVNVDARGAGDPAAVEAAVRRAIPAAVRNLERNLVERR